MKILLPILTLFLTACSVHNHRYDAEQDAYYEEDYYAYDNYDPYYGYGSSAYTSAGDGVYYNNYNYYPDRWGVTYSNAYYSPFRYPRVGFYFSSVNQCAYSYWSTWCHPGYWPSYHYTSGWWPAFGFGISYSSYYYDNYWWYNHWRNRNYYYDNYHYKPTQRGYYSARNEARRLNNNRHYNRYKETRPVYNRNYNKPQPVDRSRSSSNRPVNRAPVRNSNKPIQNNKPTYRGSQQTEVIQHNQQNSNSSSRYQSSRNEVMTRNSPSVNNQNNLQQQLREQQTNSQLSQHNRYQKPLPNTRVKPMSSQSPVYHTNRIINRNGNEQNARSSSPTVVNRNTHRPMVQRQTNNTPRPEVNQPVLQNKPASSTRSSSKQNRSRTTKEKSSKSNEHNSSGRSSGGDRSASRSRGQ